LVNFYIIVPPGGIFWLSKLVIWIRVKGYSGPVSPLGTSYIWLPKALIPMTGVSQGYVVASETPSQVRYFLVRKFLLVRL
jgi:hypothetical protein